MTRQHEPSFEESQEALEEGDRPIEISAARAALRSRDFRTVWLGALGSNIGTWMQNVTLGAFAYELTGSPAYVSLVVFAQLGPMLVLSLVGGMMADVFDRRRMIVIAQAEQAVASVVLAIVVAGPEPSRAGIVVVVMAIGIGNAMNAPAWAALLPSLVPRAHLSGAVALHSTQMNASRVVGPAIAGLLYPSLGAAGVFAVNAATYVFSIGTALAIRPPAPRRFPSGPQGLRRISEGLSVTRRDPLLRRSIITIFVFAFVCLPFIGQMPTVAAENLGMRPRSLDYGLLYAAFGIGAVVGAVSIGTFLGGKDLRVIVRRGLVGFALMLGTFALLQHPAPAYPVVLVLGFAYFATVTSVNTVLQEHVADRYRGRVMSLWQMSFGGTVPLGLMFAGPIAEATSIRVVMLYGASAALLLAWYARLPRLPPMDDT